MLARMQGEPRELKVKDEKPGADYHSTFRRPHHLRSWGGTIVLFVWIVRFCPTAHAAPPAQASPAPSSYTSPGWSQAPMPPSGRSERKLGAALMALGILRSSTAIMHLVFAGPKRCGEGRRLDWDPQSCKNLRYYGYAGLGLAGAFMVGGALELGRGLIKGRRYREWKAQHWSANLQVRYGPSPWGFVIQKRW